MKVSVSRGRGKLVVEHGRSGLADDLGWSTSPRCWCIQCDRWRIKHVRPAVRDCAIEQTLDADLPMRSKLCQLTL